MKALDAANGYKTYTFTGQPSQLGDSWTREVEDRFCELGGDALN